MRATVSCLVLTGALTLALTGALTDRADPALAADRVEVAAAKPKKNGTGKLVITREDGTTFTFRGRQARVRCQPTDSERPVPGITLVAPRKAFGGEEERDPTEPILLAEAVRADVRDGATLKLPTSNDFGDPEGASLFIFDPQPAASGEGNELSSDQLGSRGTLVARGRCGSSPRLKLTVNATLGSELFEGPSVRVRGTIIGRG